MPYLNLRERRIEATIAFVHASLDGPSAADTLRHAANHVPTIRGAITETENAVSVAWTTTLPGRFRDCDVRVHVVAPRDPSAAPILADADGVVLLASARASADAQNRRSLGELRSALAGRPVPIVLHVQDVDGSRAASDVARAMGGDGLTCRGTRAPAADAVMATLETALEEVVVAMKHDADTTSTTPPAPTEPHVLEDAHPLLTALRQVLRQTMTEYAVQLEKGISMRMEAQLARELSAVRSRVDALAEEMRSEVVRLTDARTRVDGGLLASPAGPREPRLVVVNRSIEQRAIHLEEALEAHRRQSGDSFALLEEKLNLLDIRLAQTVEQLNPKKGFVA